MAEKRQIARVPCNTAFALHNTTGPLRYRLREFPAPVEPVTPYSDGSARDGGNEVTKVEREPGYLDLRDAPGTPGHPEEVLGILPRQR